MSAELLASAESRNSGDSGDPGDPGDRGHLPDTAGRPGPSSTSWAPDDGRGPAFDGPEVAALIARIREPLYLVSAPARPRPGVAAGGSLARGRGAYRVVGALPPTRPEELGDGAFCAAHGTRYPYIAGEMANGIATVEMVTAMARAGMLGFFGAAGLPAARVGRETARIAAALGDRTNWGVNLIHSPAEPRTEQAVADLLIARRVPAVSASAFMELTPPIVQVAASGLTRDAQGRVRRAAGSSRRCHGPRSRPRSWPRPRPPCSGPWSSRAG